MTAVNKNSVRSHGHSHKNNHRAVKRQFTICISTLFIIIACCVVFGNLYSMAHDKNTYKDTCYTSITIKQGDTLWSIAEKYMTDDYESVQQYIANIKDINGLISDDIQSGMNLVVTYNDNHIVESAR